MGDLSFMSEENDEPDYSSAGECCCSTRTCSLFDSSTVTTDVSTSVSKGGHRRF